MEIAFNEAGRTFHLYNDQISYIMQVLPNGQMGQLYFGKKVHDREDFSYLLETLPRPMSWITSVRSIRLMERETTGCPRWRCFRRTAAGLSILSIKDIAL